MQVTGRGHMDINRISGYIPGKIVFFLMQARPLGPVCRTGQSPLVLTRDVRGAGVLCNSIPKQGALH